MPEQRMDVNATEIIEELRARLSDAHYEMALNAVVIRKLQAANTQLAAEKKEALAQRDAAKAATAPQTVRQEVAVPVPVPTPPRLPAAVAEPSENLLSTARAERNGSKG
jgi:hypothetical protein